MSKPLPTAVCEFPCAQTGELIRPGDVVKYLPGVGIVKVRPAEKKPNV